MDFNVTTHEPCILKSCILEKGEEEHGTKAQKCQNTYLFGTNLLISFINAICQKTVCRDFDLTISKWPKLHRYIIVSKNREFGFFFRRKLKSLKPSASKPFCKMGLGLNEKTIWHFYFIYHRKGKETSRLYFKQTFAKS